LKQLRSLAKTASNFTFKEHFGARPAPPTNVEERLPIGQSAAVITGLSGLSWGVVILLIMALRALV
jgi:hypothetical protein